MGSQFFQFYKVASQFEFPEFQSGFTFLNFYELRGGFANYPDNFKGPVTRVSKNMFSYFDGVPRVFAKGGSGRGRISPIFFIFMQK